MGPSRLLASNALMVGSVIAIALVGAVAASKSGFPHQRAAQERVSLSPAVDALGEQIAQAEAGLRSEPDSLEAYHRLAIGLMRAQRESGEPELYRRAEQALLTARKQDPEDYQTKKLLAWVLAGQHRFDEALELARNCVRQNPSDFWNYGIIGDALTETGDYSGAVAAVQKMVDLKPGALSYARAAHQRWLHGDPEGALELYDMALEATSPREKESIAWQRTQMSEIRFLSGDLNGAQAELERAQAQVPDYHLALGAQARLAAARGALAEAAAVYSRALGKVERPDWRASLGDLYVAMGQPEKAEAEYVRVEEYLRRHMEDPIADATHQLAQFLADRGRKPTQALELARREAADAQDIRANDTYAWALYHAEQYEEAWRTAQKALRLQTRDPKLLYHAGMIGLKLPAHRHAARKLLRRALSLNVQWDVLEAPMAKRALATGKFSAKALK